MVKGFFLKIIPPVNGVFYVGQDLTGTVTLCAKKSKKYASIQVNLTGEALVQNRHESTSKWAREELLNQQVILWERGQDANSELAPGKYDFPFTFRLQSPIDLRNGLPSTYESPLAKIIYTVEARIVKDGGILKRDSHSQARIQVIDLVDVNRRELLEPKIQSAERDLAYTAFSKSPVSMTIKLPRTGFTMYGDSIDFELEVQNPKKRRIGHVCVQIFKDLTYVDRGLSKSFSRIVPGASVTSEAFKSQPSCSWRGSIPVPVTEPTTTNCSSIFIKYHLSVALVVPLSSTGNMCMEIPITIGTTRSSAVLDRNFSYQPSTPATAPPLFRYHSQPAVSPYPPPGQVPAYCSPPVPYPGVLPPVESYINQQQDSATGQATAPLPPGPSEGVVGQWTSPQWTPHQLHGQPYLTPSSQPYWTSPQVSAALSSQWQNSPSSGPPPVDGELVAQEPPPPYYDGAVGSGAGNPEKQSESDKTTYFE